MVVALLDALSIGHVDIVANDRGGAIAQLLVARHPARVRTLMLTNSDVETDSPPAALLPVIEMARDAIVDKAMVAPVLARRGTVAVPDETHALRMADLHSPVRDGEV
jgi:haloalkane dehalogenase